jgi:hypothetical protein
MSLAMDPRAVALLKWQCMRCDLSVYSDFPDAKMPIFLILTVGIFAPSFKGLVVPSDAS